MIVKRNFSPAKVLGHVWQPLGFALLAALLAVAVRAVAGDGAVVVPFAPVGTLGAAVAIFVAFRNNASYGRWWEARTAWGGITDVPLTYVTTQIERDVREMVGDPALPPPVVAVDRYLW